MTIKLLEFDDNSLSHIVATLTRARLSKYLKVTDNDVQRALHLYILNTKISAAVMADLHYIEIALRNKFDRVLAEKFGQNWFENSDFLSLLSKRPYSETSLKKAKDAAGKHWPKNKALPWGKVIAELTFGFWLQLTDSNLEHELWVPCLYKAFAPRKAPKRSIFNQQLENLRQLRNRVAHHEPIFHLDLLYSYHCIMDVGQLLCPTTARMMDQTSTVKRLAIDLNDYR